MNADELAKLVTKAAHGSGMFETWDALVSTLAAFLASGCGNECQWLTERADGALARLTARGREDVPKLFNPVWESLSYITDNGSILRDAKNIYRKHVIPKGLLFELIRDAKKLPEKKVYNTDKPVFGYYRNPLPNTIDSSSGGISVFDAALSTISMADRQFSRIDYEFDSARRRIMVDEQGVKRVNGKTVLGGDVFTPVDIENLFEDFTPEVRQADFIAGLNEYKREIEFQCGLSYGDISDPQSVDKTATEVKSAKQRKYNTVTAIQKNLRTCIEELLYAIAFWEAQTTSGYKFTCDFKDSILTDEETERKQDIQDIGLGIMRPEEYRAKWYGEDLDTALKNLPQSPEVMQ